MKRLRFITLALVAAFATSAVASATAFAAKPEWFQNKAVITGKIKFEASSNKEGTLETHGGTKVTCTSDEASGEIAPPNKVEKTLVTFKGCKQVGAGECGVSGEIKSTSLEGELVYVKKEAKPPVGLLLKPTAGAFSTFTCVVFGGKVEVTVTGEVIGEATPINVEQGTGELIYLKGLNKGEQKIRQIEEEGPLRHLTCSIFFAEECAIETKELKITWLPHTPPPETKVEIKA